MGAGRRTNTFLAKGSGSTFANFPMNSADPRNLMKSELGGVIFGCTNNTIKECLFKQLFGLPAQHFSYVKNIDPGLPLFLFNYSNRRLHGIFEAASTGQMSINPYGWTTDGAERTRYPAQVQIRLRMQCQPLHEEQFKPIFLENYYTHNHFRFELDHTQTSKLVILLSSLAISPSTTIPGNTERWRNMFQANNMLETRERGEGSKPVACSLEEDKCVRASQSDVNEQDEKELVLKQLEESVLECSSPYSFSRDTVEGISTAGPYGMHLEDNDSPVKLISPEKKEESPCSSSHRQSSIVQLVQVTEELKAFKAEQALITSYMEQKLVEAEKEIQQLKERCAVLESMSNPPVDHIHETMSDLFDKIDPDITGSIHLIGGYDGNSWLSALDLYFPSQDTIRTLKPLSSVRPCASVAQLHDELYVFGGGSGDGLWYDTVESYNPANDRWTLCPSLTKKKGSLGGATLNDKIYGIGGGNGVECFSEVEMLDLDVGRWIPTRSMLEKRFALAAAEMNGALYVTGGFDGKEYLMSSERFDPREHSWRKIANMNIRRGCHSMVVLNEQLHALGGFDGNSMVSSTEVYDPRLDAWIPGDPMKKCRGYSAAAVVKDCIFVIGGLELNGDIVGTVERFKEGEGWEEKNSKVIGKRCFLSAIAL